MSRRLRAAARAGTIKTTPDGRVLKARAWGLRVGYWPCLQAPFIELAFGTQRYALWFGLPSYQVPA